MLYRLITNLLNATIYLLTVAEKQAETAMRSEEKAIERLEAKITKSEEAARKASIDSMKCRNLRNKVEGLSCE